MAERSKADRLLGLRIRIPPGAWMFVLCVVMQDIYDFFFHGVGQFDGWLSFGERDCCWPAALQGYCNARVRHCKVIATEEGVAKLLQGKSKTLQSYCNARAKHCKVIATFCGVLTSRGVD